MSAETADVLDRAADIVEANGWCQDHYYNRGNELSKPLRDCAVCARGAINLATNGRNPERLSQLGDVATDAVYQHLGISGWHPDSLADWNDKPGRTAEQVVAALRGAAAAQRERAA